MEHDDFDEEFRQVFSALKQQNGPCPDSDTLADFAEGGSLPPERIGLISTHLELCVRCQQAMRLLKGSPTEIDDMTTKRIESNMDRREFPWSSRPQKKTGFRFAVAAAAAVILSVGFWISRERTALNGPVSTTRGEIVQPLAPVDRVEAVSVFRWNVFPPASSFRIQIGQGETLIWQDSVASSPYDAPVELKRVLRPGVRFRWRVQALDGNGQIIGESSWTEFEQVR